jgi:hypothetical protein
VAIRTPHNRGFTAPRRSFTIAPVVKRPAGGGRFAKGAPTLGRRKTLKSAQPYPNPPNWWLGVVGEWVVYWYLTDRKRYVEGLDFYYQAPVHAPYLFRAKNFTRVDFLVDLGPKSRAGRIGHYSALALDPITAFTHPDPQADKRKRASLELGGYLLIFLQTEPMKLNPPRIIDAALKGKDLSNRA